MKYKNLVSALLSSTLSFCSVEAVLSQTSGMPSPVDGQPLSDEPDGFNLGFGDDDRRPMRSNAFPWSAVGRVEIDGAGHCTGALVGRDLVLTNAHCIWVGGQRRDITFAPNYRNGQAPETVRGIGYSSGTANLENNVRADWAIIRLERPIGDRYGWFGWQPVNYQELQGRTVTYVGYSTFGNEERQEFINGETAQVHVGCRVRDVYPNNGVIHTDCDNGRGGSGGPIFVWQNNRPVIVAINAAEFRGGSNTSFFAQDYTPGQGNVGVPTLTFVQNIRTAMRGTMNSTDFDGDQRTDRYEKTNEGMLLIDYARNGFGQWDETHREYGGAGARPVPADYDGDGKADFSVKLDSGEWLIDYARNGFGRWDETHREYGGVGARPVPADYDNDGRVDLSVRLENSGQQLIDYASNGFGRWDETR